MVSTGVPPPVVKLVEETAVDLSGGLRLSDGPGGSSAGPFRFHSGLTLAPGQAGQMRAVLSKTTPTGSWHVTVTLHSGNTAKQAHAVIQLRAMQPAGFVLPKRTLVAGGGLVAIPAPARWRFFCQRVSPRPPRRAVRMW